MRRLAAVFAVLLSLAGICAEGRAKCVVTYTFDDGLADQYTIAYPMFRKAGFPATFFIIGSKVGDSRGIRNKAERNTPIMTWDQIRDMSTNGMEIASHGWAHAKYAKMNRDEILDDMPALMLELLKEESRRGHGIVVRPDHGRKLDIDKGRTCYYGYDYGGRLIGLSELRGLEAGIRFMKGAVSR